MATKEIRRGNHYWLASCGYHEGTLFGIEFQPFWWHRKSELITVCIGLTLLYWNLFYFEYTYIYDKKEVELEYD